MKDRTVNQCPEPDNRLKKGIDKAADKDKAIKYLRDSIQAVDALLTDNSDWKRCKAFFNRCEGHLHHGWQYLFLLPYQEYLKTDHWQKVRKEALENAGYRCCICNAGDCELHTHHRSYERLGSEDSRRNDVIVLCAACHSLFHDKLIPATAESLTPAAD